MDLAAYQASMKALLRGEQPRSADAHVREVARSAQAEVAREVVAWWHAWRIERYCPLTSALLKRLDLFEATVAADLRRSGPAHFIEITGSRFLAAMHDHPDPLVAAVARFEDAMLRAKLGDEAEYRVAWPCDPRPVLNALVQGTPLETAPAPGAWTIVVARHLPGMMQIQKALVPSAASHDRP